MSKFTLGQSVWDSVFYPGVEGIVTNTEYTVEFPMQVAFGDKEERYTEEGLYRSNVAPTLSAVPYEFSLPEQPEHFEAGELVLVRDIESDLWSVDRFDRVEEREEYKFKCTRTVWKHIRKFDAELALTNGNK